jgi:hypothetical protein
MEGWFVGVLFLLLFVGPPVLLWYLSWHRIGKYLTMRKWPRAPGIVKESRTVPMTRGSVRIEVRAAFLAAGRNMDVWCESPGRTGYSVKDVHGPAKVRALLENNYAPGSALQVIYNPDSPAEAYFQMPSLLVTFAMGAGGLLWLGVGAASLLM